MEDRERENTWNPLRSVKNSLPFLMSVCEKKREKEKKEGKRREKGGKRVNIYMMFKKWKILTQFENQVLQNAHNLINNPDQ